MSYPLLAQFRAPSSLCAQLRTTLLAVGHVAAGDAPAAVAAFSHLGHDHRAKAYELAIVQSAPLVGVPRVLHSAAALQVAGVYMGPDGGSAPPSPSPSQPPLFFASQQQQQQEESVATRAAMLDLPAAPAQPEALLDTGRAVFDAVYARNSARVQRRLHTMHPGLCDWILRCVYGQVLSRVTATAPAGAAGRGDDDAAGGEDEDDDDGDRSGQTLSLRERELAVVAALCVDPVAAVQLASHLRGALNAGASGDEIDAVVRATRLTRAEAADNAEAVLATFRRARYAL